MSTRSRTITRRLLLLLLLVVLLLRWFYRRARQHQRQLLTLAAEPEAAAQPSCDAAGDEQNAVVAHLEVSPCENGAAPHQMGSHSTKATEKKRPSSLPAPQLQVAISRIKLRNLAPRVVDGPLASLRKRLFRTAPLPAYLSIDLQWGSHKVMHTCTVPYPLPGESLVWPDRFSFEHVSQRGSIGSERLELAVYGCADAPRVSATQEGASTVHEPLGDGASRTAAAAASTASVGAGSARATGARACAEAGARAELGARAAPIAASSAATPTAVLAAGGEVEPEKNEAPPRDEGVRRLLLGRLSLPLEAVACGPTRNDHLLSLDPALDSGGGGVPTGARLAFRCRVSELRPWRLQLDRVRMRIHHEALEPHGSSAAGGSRAYVFSLSYNFTSGSTDHTSREREWRARSSQLVLPAPGAEVDLQWSSQPRTPPVPPPSLDGSAAGSRDGSTPTSNTASNEVRAHRGEKAGERCVACAAR